METAGQTARRTHVQGDVYLLHFDRKLAHAGHYLGWAEDGKLEKRLAAHKAGRGARLTQVLKEQGIGWTVARTWKGDRHLERKLKNRKGAKHLCPVCRKEKGDALELA